MSIAIHSKLTSTQKNIVALLELRGAYESSRAAEKAWSTGESFQLDSRNGAARGIVRLINKANKEANNRANAETKKRKENTDDRI